MQRFEKATWIELDRLCRETSEAGIHFQETKVYGRKKDVGTATGQWLEELTKEDAWFKNTVPDVRYFVFRYHHCPFLVIFASRSAPRPCHHGSASI